MKKTYFFMCCAFAGSFLLSLSGCVQSASVSASSVFATQETSPEGSSSREDENNDSTSMIEQSSESLIPVQLLTGSNFSDGMAWVTFQSPSGEETLGLLNTSGEIIPLNDLEKIQDGNVEKSDFLDGYAYVNYKDETLGNSGYSQYLILDSSGNIVAQSPSDADYRILAGGGDVYLVQQTLLSMTENEVRLGIMDQNGSWLVEPAADNVMSFSDEMIPNLNMGHLNEAKISYYYYGEHIFCADYRTRSDHGFRLYNVDTGKAAEFEEISLCNGEATALESNQPTTFFDHKAIAISSDTIYCLDTDFTLTPVLMERPNGDVFFSNGIFFTGEKEHNSMNGQDYIKNAKFYNSDGTVKADLSEYTFLQNNAEDLYRYKDGIAAVLVYGADYGEYIGLLDESGEFIFEPKKINANTTAVGDNDSLGNFADGVILIQDDEGWGLLTADGEIARIDATSNSAFIKSLTAYGFSCGFAWNGWENGGQYVAVDGSALQTFERR